MTRIVLLWVNNHFNDFEGDPAMTRFLEEFEKNLEDTVRICFYNSGVSLLPQQEQQLRTTSIFSPICFKIKIGVSSIFISVLELSSS